MPECYRHPGRTTNVACSNCVRPICPDCMTVTPVGMRCPECARQRTQVRRIGAGLEADRKSTRLNSSHVRISYAVFCLKKKKPQNYRKRKPVKKTAQLP